MEGGDDVYGPEQHDVIWAISEFFFRFFLFFSFFITIN